MENKLIVTGTTDKELLLALKLAYELKFGLSEYKGIWTWGDNDDTGYIYFSNDCEPNDICTERFPCNIDEETLLSIIKTYLTGFHTKSTGGDGSYGRGWYLETSYWGDKYDIKVKFKTMYYGK